MKDRINWAIPILVLGATIISFSGVWVKWSHVSSMTSAFYRVAFGGLFLVLASLIRSELRWPGGRQLTLVLMCSFFFTLDLWLYHYSINHVGPGLGTILPNFQVFILTAAGIIFLNETVRVTFLIAVPTAIAGLVIIVGIDWGHLDEAYKMGVYAGLAAAVCYAGFLLSLRKLQSYETGASFFYILMLVSLMSALFLGTQIHLSGDSFSLPGFQSLFSLLALGFFSQFFGWILIANALPRTRTSISGLVLLLQPALAFVWDVLLFDRLMSPTSWVGVSLVLIAIYIGTSRPSASHKIG